MTGAYAKYYDLEGFSGVTLQRQNLIPKKPRKTKEIVNGHKPFLFRLLGSIGFAPHPVHWKAFRKWLLAIDLNTYDAYVPGLVTSDWYKNGKRQIWTQLWIDYCHRNSLYTLYINLPDKVSCDVECVIMHPS